MSENSDFSTQIGILDNYLMNNFTKLSIIFFENLTGLNNILVNLLNKTLSKQFLSHSANYCKEKSKTTDRESMDLIIKLNNTLWTIAHLAHGEKDNINKIKIFENYQFNEEECRYLANYTQLTLKTFLNKIEKQLQ